LLNPKALLFCSMFLPQFVAGSDSVGLQYLRLGVILVLGLLFDAVYAIAAARLARRLRGKPSPYGKFVLPTVFVLLAGRLVLG
jgi:threonine/homoserine/homoserine lactone efflux protein